MYYFNQVVHDDDEDGNYYYIFLVDNFHTDPTIFCVLY